MKYPKGIPTHGKMDCCPKEWDRVPDISGSHELDAVIRACSNKNVPAKLAMYCSKGSPYSIHTGYNGYSPE